MLFLLINVARFCQTRSAPLLNCASYWTGVSRKDAGVQAREAPRTAKLANVVSQLCTMITGGGGIPLLVAHAYAVCTRHSSLYPGLPAPGCEAITLFNNFVSIYVQRSDFKSIGVLTAMSIMHEGPGLPVFHEAVYEYMSSKIYSVQAIKNEDVPNHSVQILLSQVCHD